MGNGLWLGLAELFEEHSATSITDTEQSKLINILEVKQIGIGVNKMDCDIPDSKQYKNVNQELRSKHSTTPRNIGVNLGWYEWYRWYELNERDD